MNVLKQIQVQLSSIFKKLKFFEISNQSGETLLFPSETISVGDEVQMKDKDGNIVVAPDGKYNIATSAGAIAIEIKDGKIVSITNSETNEELQSFTFPSVVTQNASVAQSEQNKVEQNKIEQKKELSKFMAYMTEKYINDVSMAEYPWEECVADMTEQGYDCPECICAAIKNRTVAHKVAQGISIDKAIKQVADEVQKSDVLKYTLKKMLGEQTKPVEQSSETKETEKVSEVSKDEIEELKKQFTELQNSVKELATIVVKQTSIKQSANSKNIVAPEKTREQEIEEFRKKYYNA